MANVFKQLIISRLWAGKYFGINVYLHWSWLLLMLWAFMQSRTLGVVLIFVYLCVLAHEFGHALVAKRLGNTVSSINLLAIGGVAFISSLSNSPKNELLITLGGPAVNLVLAPFCFALMLAFEPESYWWTMCLVIGAANLVMLAINLLPMFPTDGGRIFRATWALSGGNYETGTLVAVRLGQVLSAAMGTIGLLLGWILWPCIAVILIVSAEMELVQMKENQMKDNQMEENQEIFGENS